MEHIDTHISCVLNNSDEHFIIYKIINNLNGKYYIGQHHTFDIFDNYAGSGKLIKKAEKHYGLSAFTKIILFDFGTFQEMDEKEQELIQLSSCYPLNSLSYNLREGGSSGKHSQTSKDRQSASHKGKVLTETHKNNISESVSKLVWINNGVESRFVQEADIPPFGWKRGRLVSAKMLAHNKVASCGKKRKGKKHVRAHARLVEAANKYYRTFLDVCLSMPKLKIIYPELATIPDGNIWQWFSRYLPNYPGVRALKKQFNGLVNN